MAYLGNTPQTQTFTPAIDYFNGNGANTSFTLTRPVASVAQIQVVIENVPQNPSSSYTVSGNVITFTSAPPSGTNNIYVEYTSPITQYNSLSQSPSVVGDFTASGGYYAVGAFTSGYVDGTVMDYVSGLGRISVGASDGLAFYRNGIGNTESMRIDTSGNVGIGTASPATKLDVNGTIKTSVNGLFTWDASGNWCIQSDDSTYMRMFAGGSERMRISSTGGLSVGTTADPGAGAIYATGNITAYYSSDRRLKENIKDVDNALDIVCAIGSKTFDWTDEYIASKGGEDGYFVQKSDFGVVAQDVQEVFPQAVRTREDGTLAVDYEKLATLSFGAIKLLLARVEALEAK